MSNKTAQLLNFIVEKFEAMPLVNTIVFKDDDVLDVEKENIYPLVSLVLLESIKETDNIQTRMSFEILNQRDVTNKPTPSKLMSDVNYIDNIGICDSIGNNFVMEIWKSHNDLDINVLEYTPFEYVKKDERNNLDGVKFEVTFSMHQNAV